MKADYCKTPVRFQVVNSLSEKAIEVFKLAVDRNTQRLKRASGGMDPPFFIRSDGAFN